MLKFFSGSKKQAAAASTTAKTTLASNSIPGDDKMVSELSITPQSEEYLQSPLEDNDLVMFKEALNYVVVRTSPNSFSNIEILHPISVPKEFVTNPEAEKLEIIKDAEDKKVNGTVKELSGEEEQILHAIYSKQIIGSNVYQCTLKQVYNDYVVGEAKHVSLVGEPTIAIHTPQLETELRRTGALSNTWHFDFEGKDYRWKPTLFGAKDSDLICELIEYELPLFAGSGSGKKKKKEVVATLKRKDEGWDMIGDLCILKDAWQDVRNHRALEIILVTSCLIMLDIIETS